MIVATYPRVASSIIKLRPAGPGIPSDIFKNLRTSAFQMPAPRLPRWELVSGTILLNNHNDANATHLLFPVQDAGMPPPSCRSIQGRSQETTEVADPPVFGACKTAREAAAIFSADRRTCLALCAS